jgi:hypothetical protein
MDHVPDVITYIWFQEIYLQSIQNEFNKIDEIFSVKFNNPNGMIWFCININRSLQTQV